MDFQHTEDRRMLADTLNRFITEQYAFPVRDRIAQSAEGFDRAMWQRFAELGTVGALFAETDGGFGGAGFDIAWCSNASGAGSSSSRSSVRCSRAARCRSPAATRIASGSPR
ncbi:hypothetical protein CSX04_00473 [Burkholderia cepacia]|nr:hypothetical protein CSX04_00473 [Burkholderia cepacia]